MLSFHLHKMSQTASVSPEWTVSAYERELNKEGLTGGYHPVEGPDKTLNECLNSRIPNLFFLRYGGIEELCIGAFAETPSKKSFTVKSAPRAATGPDLRRVLIGAKGALGTFYEATLKVFPIPEHTVWGMFFVDSPDQARRMLLRAQDRFIRPLFAAWLDADQAQGIFKSLTLVSQGPLWAVKLSGLKGMVDAEKSLFEEAADAEGAACRWLSRSAEDDVLDRALLKPKNQSWRDEDLANGPGNRFFKALSSA